MKKPKPGRPNEGLTEDTAYVRGPAELMKEMRELAKRMEVTTSEIWRRAAEAYLRSEK